jgi:hypothetical protein
MDTLQEKLKRMRQDRWTKFEEESANARDLFLKILTESKDKKRMATSLKWRDEGDNFDQRIFELISKAQYTPENYYRLMIGFPDYVRMWEEWQDTADEQQFFNKYGVK